MLIQLGAILALLSIYFTRLWRLALDFFTDPQARRFVFGILVAFLPAAILGAIAHGFIKSVLFNPWIICFTLIAGGGVLLWVDRLDLDEKVHRRRQIFLADVSGHRAGAVRVDDSRRVALRRDHRRRHADGRRAPCGGGVFVLAGDADHDRRLRLRSLQGRRASQRRQQDCCRGRLYHVVCVSAGFIVKTFIGYVSRHGFALFAWWRVIVGTLG